MKSNSTQCLSQYEGKTITHYEGYLYVQTRNFLPLHLWKKRYVTLKDGFLYFTKNKGDLIFHDTTTKLEINADTAIFPENDKQEREKYYIRINHRPKSFTLCTTNEDERNDWINSLLTVMTQTFVTLLKQCPTKRHIENSTFYARLDKDFKDTNKIPVTEQRFINAFKQADNSTEQLKTAQYDSVLNLSRTVSA